MSKEYIERDCLIDMIAERNRNTCNGKMSCIQMKRMVESIPAADVAPVRHGRWEWRGPCHDNNGKYWATCNACKKRQRLGDYERFCPNCGAKMDLEG